MSLWLTMYSMTLSKACSGKSAVTGRSVLFMEASICSRVGCWLPFSSLILTLLQNDPNNGQDAISEWVLRQDQECQLNVIQIPVILAIRIAPKAPAFTFSPGPRLGMNQTTAVVEAASWSRPRKIVVRGER